LREVYDHERDTVPNVFRHARPQDGATT